jgi:hypothetical protein
MSIQILSNPPKYSTIWSKDDTPLKSTDKITVGSNYIFFNNSLLPDDNGTYTYNVSNILGFMSSSIDLNVYYGPSFKEGNINSSMWIERKTNSTFILMCQVDESNPPDVALTTNAIDSSNVAVNHINDTALSITVTEAAYDNSMNYTCFANNSKIITNMTYQTFVGGVPDGVNVVVKDNLTDASFSLSMTVSDTSKAPARSIIYNNLLVSECL